MRRFGRRGFRGRRGSFRRRRLARKLGAYEILLEDFSSTEDAGPTLGIGHAVVFPTGATGALSYREVASSAGEPPDLQFAGATQQVIRVSQSGFAVAIPLWDNRLANKWQDDVSLASLRGYLRPKRIQIVKGSSPTNAPCKVRMAIVMQQVSENSALEGAPGTTSGLPQWIWTIASQRQRILWQRDWYLLANPDPDPESEYKFWRLTSPHNNEVSLGTNEVGLNEPRLASCGGSDLVRLKRCGRISRTRWPILLVGVKTSILNLDLTNLSGEVTSLSSTTELTVDFDGFLKAYVSR